MAALPTSTFSARYLERAISTLTWRGTTTTFVYLCYTNLVGDGHHQKYECDTNFFVCLLVHNLCRSPEQRSRLHEIRRRVDGDLLRGAERRAGVHARLSRRLAPNQEEGNNGANPIRNRQSIRTTVSYCGAICKAGVSPLNATVASCSRTSNSR